MVRHSLLSAALAVGLASFVHAQTFTTCDPLKDTCPDNPALSESKLSVDFTTVKSLPGEWETENQGSVTFNKNGANIAVGKSGDSLNVISKFYVLFGTFEFKVKSAPGLGMVSSIVLISDVRDEIDWEILGKEPDKIQSNYFGKGDDSDFTRGGFHSAPANQEKYISYKIDWTPEYVAWSIDGQVVRKLAYGDAKGGTRFPQTPMRIKLGAWAPGDPTMNRKGTVEWSGGPIDWSKGPFVMGVQSLNIVNSSPGKAYVYSDKSGSYQSIKVVDGLVNSNGAAAPPPPPAPTTSAKPISPPPSLEQTSMAGPESIPSGASPTSAPDNTTIVTPTLAPTTPKTSISVAPKATTSAPPVNKNGASLAFQAAMGYALVPCILAGAWAL